MSAPGAVAAAACHAGRGDARTHPPRRAARPSHPAWHLRAGWPTVEAFETPLGRITIDRAALDSLADLPQVVARDDAHAASMRSVQLLPFLQTVLADFRLVPLVVAGTPRPKAVAGVITRLWGGGER